MAYLHDTHEHGPPDCVGCNATIDTEGERYIEYPDDGPLCYGCLLKDFEKQAAELAALRERAERAERERDAERYFADGFRMAVRDLDAAEVGMIRDDSPSLEPLIEARQALRKLAYDLNARRAVLTTRPTPEPTP